MLFYSILSFPKTLLDASFLSRWNYIPYFVFIALKNCMLKWRRNVKSAEMLLLHFECESMKLIQRSCTNFYKYCEIMSCKNLYDSFKQWNVNLLLLQSTYTHTYMFIPISNCSQYGFFKASFIHIQKLIKLKRI